MYKGVFGCKGEQIGGVKIKAGKFPAEDILQMAQKVCNISVFFIQREPYYVIPFIGVLRQESGFTITCIGVDVCKAAAGGAIFSFSRGRGTVVSGAAFKGFGLLFRYRPDLILPSSGFSAVSGISHILP